MKYSYHTISHAKLAPARYEWMTRQAERAGIELHHAPWVTVADLPRVPHQYSERLARIYYRRPLLPTELACTLSHLGLWRKLLASDEDAYVIFEDDVELDPHLDQLVREALATGLPRLVRLSAFYDQPYTVVAELSHERQLIRMHRGSTSVGGYLITRQAAAALLPYHERIFMVIDLMLSRTWEHGVAHFAIRPYPVQHAQHFASVVGNRQLPVMKGNWMERAAGRLVRLSDSVLKRVIVPTH